MLKKNLFLKIKFIKNTVFLGNGWLWETVLKWKNIDLKRKASPSKVCS